MSRNIKVKQVSAAAPKAAKVAPKKVAKVVAMVAIAKGKVASGKRVTANPGAVKPVSLDHVKRAEAKNGQRIAYANNAASPYAGMKGAAKGAYTMAGLLVSGLVTLSKGVFSIGKDNPSIALFRAIVGATPVAHHRGNGNIAGDRLTVQGLNHFTARNSGEGSTYNTHLETVSAFVQAVTKGGTIECEGVKLAITKQVGVPVTK